MPSTSRAEIKLLSAKTARINATLAAAAWQMSATGSRQCKVNQMRRRPARRFTRTIVFNLEDTTWKGCVMRRQHIDGAAATHSVLS